MKRIILYVFIFFSIHNYAQLNTSKDSINSNNANIQAIFLDENRKPIEIFEYYKKCKSFLYYCNKKSKDSITVHKMLKIYKFGKLNLSETNQLRKLLQRDINTPILDNSIILINYQSKLFGYDTLKRRFDSLVKIRKNHQKYLSNNSYKKRRNDYDDLQKKCKRKYRKTPLIMAYLYGKNIDFKHTYKNLEWEKAHTSISRMFFKDRNSGMLLLKPNGQYFIFDHIGGKNFEQLINKDWEPFIKDYNIAKKNLLKKPNGFFFSRNRYSKTTRFIVSDKPRNSTIFPSNRRNSNGAITVKSEAEAKAYMRTNKMDMPCFIYSSY